MRRRFRRQTRLPLFFACCAGVLTLRIAYDVRSANTTNPDADHLPPGRYHVQENLDGFQLVLSHVQDSSRTATLRLLGVAPPASASDELTGKAKRFVDAMIVRQTVRLRLDRRRQDVDGTLLGYLYVGDRLLNADLVGAGLAELHTRPGDSAAVVRLLSNACEQARSNQRGIWSVRNQ